MGPNRRGLIMTELALLYFIQGAALGIWLVPLTTVLEAHGLASIRHYAYATSAIAAFVSPLLFAAVADRHMAPVRVLRWLAVATATTLILASLAIRYQIGEIPILVSIQIYALCASPSWSLASTIVFGALSDARTQFGPLRATATLGWMVGCWLVSAFDYDASTTAGFLGALTWLVLALFTLSLPSVDPPPSTGPLTLAQRFGWDAMGLLRDVNHQGMFVTVALFTIPLAAFYPYTPLHLKALGLDKTTAWMTLGQVTEIVAMIGLGLCIQNMRLRWIVAIGLGFGILRYALSALGTKTSLIAGVTLHGCSYTLVFICTQVYLAERIEVGWTARAQALLTFMTSGVGNLIGYLLSGLWFKANTQSHTGHTQWPDFWMGLSISCFLILLYFLKTYRGRPA